MKTTYLFKTLVIAILALAASAKAQVVFDDLGDSIIGADSISTYSQDVSFTSAASAQSLTGIELGLSDGGRPGTLTVGLYSDSGTYPGALISTLGTLNDAVLGAGPAVYSVSVLTDPVLAPNTRYWIGLRDTGDVDWDFTHDSAGIEQTTEYHFVGGQGVQANGDYLMEVSTSPGSVPDAGNVTFIAAFGLMAMTRFIRNRR